MNERLNLFERYSQYMSSIAKIQDITFDFAVEIVL